METPLITQLRSIGMPEKSATVYAAVLEMGIAFPSTISEKTSLNRSTVYKILDDLRLKGLVTEIEHGKKKSYQIEDPIHLQSLAKRQITSAEERYERAKKMLPELQGIFSLLPNKPRVRFFEGIDGVISIYREHVAQEKPYEMLSYSNVEELMKMLPQKFVTEYVNQKEKIGITTRAFFPQSTYSKEYNKEVYSGVEKRVAVKTKFIPSETFPYTADITMYGTRNVSIINFHKNILIGVVIEDPTIYGMMRMAFNLAWNNS